MLLGNVKHKADMRSLGDVKRKAGALVRTECLRGPC